MGPLVVLAAVTLSAVAWLTVREVDQRVTSDGRSTAATLGSLISGEKRHLELQTRLLADQPYLKFAALTHDRMTAQDRVEKSQRSVDSDGLLLVNVDGEVWAGSGPLAGLVGHASTGFGTIRALDGNPWSGIQLMPNGLVLAATAPLMVDRYSKGALVAYTLIDSAKAKTISSEIGMQVAFTSKGRVVASSMPITGRSIPGNGRVRLQVGGNDLVGKWSLLPGGSDGQEIGLVALRPMAEIVAPSSELFRALLGVLVVAIGATALLARRLSKILTAPLGTVVQAAYLVESGQWPDSLEVSGVAEVAVLQTAFNRMATSVKQHQEKLESMIDLDPLTELPNHRRFKENLAQAIVREQAKSSPVTVLLFDIDRFDDFNRANGLIRGDAVIKTLSEIAQSRATEGCLAARYGGDQLVLLLPEVSPEGAWKIAEEIRYSFNATIGSSLTLSAGLAHVTPTTDRAESLCLAAELALAKAKQLGRNQVCTFESMVGDKQSDPYELHRFLENATLSTVQALAAAVDAKDPYTQGHSQRVAEYAAGLCRFVGGSDSEVELVYRTATLHDVGKIGIPDEILKKPGPLNDEEKAVMDTHPALGEVIVAKVPYLQDTLSGVRHHHERWDGQGYPDSLAGESIPRLARILALADTYDAMTSDRPYRKGLSVETALGEIAKNAGRQFDPELAPAFVLFMSGHLGVSRAA